MRMNIVSTTNWEHFTSQSVSIRVALKNFFFFPSFYVKRSRIYVLRGHLCACFCRFLLSAKNEFIRSSKYHLHVEKIVAPSSSISWINCFYSYRVLYVWSGAIHSISAYISLRTFSFLRPRTKLNVLNFNFFWFPSQLFEYECSKALFISMRTCGRSFLSFPLPFAELDE